MNVIVKLLLFQPHVIWIILHNISFESFYSEQICYIPLVHKVILIFWSLIRSNSCMAPNPIPVDPPELETFSPCSPSKPCKCHWFQTPPSPEFCKFVFCGFLLWNSSWVVFCSPVLPLVALLDLMTRKCFQTAKI